MLQILQFGECGQRFCRLAIVGATTVHATNYTIPW